MAWRLQEMDQEIIHHVGTVVKNYLRIMFYVQQSGKSPRILVLALWMNHNKEIQLRLQNVLSNIIAEYGVHLIHQ